MTARSGASAARRRGEMPGSLGPRLRLLYQAWVAQRHEALAAAGYSEIRLAHGVVFQYLPPEGARVTELAARSQVTKQQMSLLVDELVQLGYLERVPDPTDGRAHIVRLTAQGEALFAVVREINARVEREWAARLDEHRLERLNRDLVELIRALGLAE